MQNNRPRDTPERVCVPKGYDVKDVLDFDSEGYGFEDEDLKFKEVAFDGQEGD